MHGMGLDGLMVLANIKLSDSLCMSSLSSLSFGVP